MGTGAEIALLSLAAAGTGAAVYNTVDTQRRADRTAAQGIRQQATNQREVDDRINQEVSRVASSNADDARVKSTNDFLGALRRTRTAATPTGFGGGSSRFTADSGAVGDEVQSYGADVADTLGRIGAPGLQRQAEGQGFARLASDIGATARKASGDLFLNQLRQRSVQPNAGLSLFSGLAGGASQGLAARGYGASGSITPGGTRVDVPARSRGVGGLA